MMRAAEQHGAKLHHGEVTGVVRRGDGVTGVEVDGETIAADAIVIAMGPWSSAGSRRGSGCQPVFGMQSPSLVYDTGKDVPAEALYLEYSDRRRLPSRSRSSRARTAARTSARSRGRDRCR